MVSFAGYNMPVQFEGVIAEHETVRNGVGVFDVSHMGEFWIRGPKAFELVQRLTSNDVAKLDDGKIQYTCFPNDVGGIVDDLLVYRFDAETYLLVVNAARIGRSAAAIVEGRHLVVLLDASASMQATDVPPSRIDAARDAVRALELTAKDLDARGCLGRVTFDLGEVRFGITICYDNLFPELALVHALNNVDLILAPHAARTGPRGGPPGSPTISTGSRRRW